MHFKKLMIGCIFASFLVLETILALAATSDVDAKKIWQLLDYVAVDYAGAVKQGSVASESEYKEMLEFTEAALNQAQRLPTTNSSQQLIKKITSLQKAVKAKAENQEVSDLAKQANTLLLNHYPILATPKKITDFTRGKSIYAQQCISCRGQYGGGDGPLAFSLEPPPIAFNDLERARSRSLMALYLVISQGVQGTSMKSFSHLHRR